MRSLLIVFVLIFTSPSICAQEPEQSRVIAPAEFREQVFNRGVQLVDVRTPEEFSEGHIVGAKNIDFYSQDFLVRFEQFNKDKPLYIYCRSGKRSSKAAKKLSEAGFEIVDLKGGYLSWEKSIEE